MPASNTRSLVLLIFILASHIPHAPARHHHIKLRHERHRRQHGDSYLPANFVLDNNKEETGTWGPWSSPSSCSRSCGGGVAYQTRRCNDLDPDGRETCTGAKKKFFSCNIGDCPEPANDFRAEQCAAYDKTPIDGINYEWVPYTGAPNKCELNCKPRGEKFYYRHKLSVADGTPCVSGQNDVCVEGKCMPVGCDMMLGSGAKEDRCRECGGDGSACDLRQDILDTDNLEVGYNDLLLIPKGATNIAIAERRPSNNYLAIRNSTGHFYLNGNWRIDFPRSFTFAGTVFKYERRPMEIMAADIITALGPTTEDIFLVLLKQAENVGIKYEFSIPKKFSKDIDSKSYTWVMEKFSDCSSTCGGGFQSRLVRCVRRGDNEEVDDTLCDQQLEPPSNVPCGEEACPPEWVIGDWGPCSKTCGLGGERTREIKCEQIISGGIPSLVDDSRCLEIIGPKDIEIQECNTDIACPQWHVGPWRPCDHLCGEGKERRKITCYRKVDGKIIALPDSACPEERPESEKDCELRPCAGVDWVVSKWSGCDNKCGLTQETRTVSCVSLEDKTYPNEKCNPHTKPASARDCAAQEKCNYQWYATQWSECSVECGIGIATRKVFCATSDPNLSCITKVEDEKCDSSTRYNDTKECIAEVKECKGEWFAGPWSKCSEQCGGGDMTRKVICMKDNKVVPLKDNCYAEDILYDSQDCNEKACEEDGVIPEERGKPNAPTGDEEEECEDYEDDEFISVNQDLGTQRFRNDDEIESSGAGLENLMMNDDLSLSSNPLERTLDNNDRDYSDESGSGLTPDPYATETDNSTLGSDTSETSEYTVVSSFSDITIASETSTSGTSLESSSETNEMPSTDTAASTSSVVSESSNSETAPPSDSDTSKVSSVETSVSTTTVSSSEETVSPDSSTIGSASAETLKSSDSDTIESSGTNTAISTSIASTVPNSFEPSETSTSDTTGISETFDPDTKSSIESDGTASTDSIEQTSSVSDKAAGISSSASVSNSVSIGETTETSKSTVVSSSGEISSTTGLETSTSGTSLESSSETKEMSSTDTAGSTTSDVSGSSISETAPPSYSDTSKVSSVETSDSTTTVSNSEETVSSDSSTIDSASTETMKSSDSGTIESSGTNTAISASTVSTVSTEQTRSTEASGTSESSGLTTSVDQPIEQGKEDYVEEPPPSDTKKPILPDSTTVSADILSSTSVSGPVSIGETTDASESTVVSSSGETESITTLETSSSEMSSMSSPETSSSTDAGLTDSTVSEISVSSDLVTSEPSITNAVESSDTDTTLSPSSDETSTDATAVSSTVSSATSGTTIKDSASSEITVSSDSDTIETSSSSTTSASTILTVSTDSETSVSSDLDITETSGADTTTSASTISTVVTSSETTVLSSSDTTGSSSSEISESSTPGTSVSPSSETTLSSGSDETASISSTSTSETTEYDVTSVTDGTVTESTETSTQSTQSVETSEPDITTTYLETTVSGETDITTESDTTSDTTESGVTETDYDLDTTEQSHISDIFTTVGPINRVTGRRPKCRPKKPKTCKTSPFGCCYDGIKFATGPFGRGCPIPKTCNETEYGCCPDGVSPATGKNNQGCPDSHCWETLFGCCPDEVTPAEGNDYQGCKIPCSGTEFGCCPDGKTPASGEHNFGCCNVTTYGCCANGIEPASGPDGEGCKEGETTSTITTPTEETTTEITSDVTDEQTTYTPTTTTEISQGCEESEFGCCPDNKTSAAGENYAGCDIINTENCTASYYKCCPDGVSAALGPNNDGCPVACQSSKFGCCIDESTPAHGPNKEGCCLNSPYGCCPDNIRNAPGPNYHGCGCQYSRYGCCPDNKTTALGSYNEGCGCEYTPHGCCPNRLNVAHGPDFEGCPCHTYQFGCCPDGISIAKGPHKQGCGCENTKFKCCSDGVTPAKGPNYAGCTCDVSKYGCCPDGIEEAQGENFEGCLRVISSPAAICTLNKETGPCTNYTVKWYYDASNGMCDRFWYGGCEGNENKFRNQQECSDICVKPKGSDVCLLPKIPGGCDGYNRKWYYDVDRKQCAQFIYGGCRGNANNFETREDCENLCVVPDDVDPCEQPNEPGPCEGNFTRWYFNAESSSCEEFNYGGCRGNKNNFQTEISCRQQCVTPGLSRVRDVCNLEKEPGPCPGSLLRWYYDAKRKSCRQFVYGGCKGNGNKFRTYAACEQRCPHGESCSLPRQEGTCTEKLSRWSFVQSENRCMPFYYTGCGGNRNNYETRDACDADCPAKIEQDTCLLPAIMGECSNYTQRWYYDSYEKHCRLFYYGGCGGNGNNFKTEHDCTHRCESSAVTPVVPEFRREHCFLPESHGPCNEESLRWYYDSRSGICQQFYYGGCQSNGNNFETVEECENRCGNVQDLCDLPAIVGPCKASIKQYFYDGRTDLCYEFAFGGCQGNKNRFDDKQSCEQRCRKTPDTTTPVTRPTTPRTGVEPKSASCFAPLDFGACTENITAFYYDVEKQICQAFFYGGCEGNANRFQSLEQCERICGSFQGQDVCNLPLDPGPCRDSYNRFFYDSRTRECRPFAYGGCLGNGNRFTYRQECESVCIHREEPPAPGNRTTHDNTVICREPVSVGYDGGSGYYKRFYYDDERLDCITFIYKGSGGNLNRFKSRESCLKTCLKSNEVDPKNIYPEDPCVEAQKECNEIRCRYGMVARVDEQNCERCSCVDPCLPVTCQMGSKCVVTPVLQGDSVVYQGNCEIVSTVPKPGMCPPVVTGTSCEEECDADAKCPEDLKCCPTSCGLSCLKPAAAVQPVEPTPREPPPTPPPVPEVTTISISQLIPIVIQQPEEPRLRAEEGGYVIMKCVAIGYPRPVITWRKDVTLIDSSMGRHSIKDDGSLQIVGLYSSDAGIYTCTATNRMTAPAQIQYELDITDPRGDKSCAILGEPDYRVTVNLNSPAYLKCFAMGWPRPIVTWWHEGEIIPVAHDVYELQRDYALKIHRVSLANLGVYTCQAYNGIAKATSWSVTLQTPGPVINVNPEYERYTKYIIEPTRPKPPVLNTRREYPENRPMWPKAPVTQPHPPFYPQSKAPYIQPVNVTEPPPAIETAKYRVPVKVNVTAEDGQFQVGSDFSILCDVNGYPIPTLQWYKDDTIIQTNERIKIVEANRLSISNAEKNDSGRYRCEAANQYSSDSGSVDIVVSGIYIHPTCQDNLFLANCNLIVKGKYCQHAWYARFCCRSCTEAGQLPPRGPHINETSRQRRSILSFG